MEYQPDPTRNLPLSEFTRDLAHRDKPFNDISILATTSLLNSLQDKEAAVLECRSRKSFLFYTSSSNPSIDGILVTAQVAYHPLVRELPDPNDRFRDAKLLQGLPLNFEFPVSRLRVHEASLSADVVEVPTRFGQQPNRALSSRRLIFFTPTYYFDSQGRAARYNDFEVIKTGPEALELWRLSTIPQRFLTILNKGLEEIVKKTPTIHIEKYWELFGPSERNTTELTDQDYELLDRLVPTHLSPVPSSNPS